MDPTKLADLRALANADLFIEGADLLALLDSHAALSQQVADLTRERDNEQLARILNYNALEKAEARVKELEAALAEIAGIGCTLDAGTGKHTFCSEDGKRHSIYCASGIASRALQGSAPRPDPRELAEPSTFADAWLAIGSVPDFVVAAARDAVEEYRGEARRCRRMARAMLDHCDANGVTIEMEIGPREEGDRNILHIVLCAPGLNELTVGDAFVEAVREAFHLMGIDLDQMSKRGLTGTAAEERHRG